MAGTNESLFPLYTALDPKSLILSQLSNLDDKPQLLQLTTDSFLMERGPRYKAYADLREKRLRFKNMKQQEKEDLVLTPPKKQVKFQGGFVTPPKRNKGLSVLAQSVPDFSSALRKENRKPPPLPLPCLKEKSATPPPGGSKNVKLYGGVVGGSKSVNSGEKRNGGLLMSRKSYANVEELKGLASVARNAINGENRVGRNSNRIAGRTVLGYRQI